MKVAKTTARCPHEIACLLSRKIPRFSRHSKCLSNRPRLSSVQNFGMAIGKPIGVRGQIIFVAL